MRTEVRSTGIQRIFLIVGVLTTVYLTFNIAAIPVTSKLWIFNPGILFPVGWIILTGFVMILFFNISAVIRAACRVLLSEAVPFDFIALTGGIVCTLLLGGEKVMIDEIARETRLSMGAGGEWAVLYVGLTIQLMYNLFVILHLRRSIREMR